MKQTGLKHPIYDGDHFRGSLDNQIQIVEYGDFECPFCTRAFFEIEEFLREYGKQVCYAFRHFPLQNAHPHSLLAAVASEAADAQEQFWPMHHLLFDNSDQLSKDLILKLGEELELDMTLFKQDLTRKDLVEKVRQDMIGGEASGIEGVPAVFINGAPMTQALTFQNLRAVVNEIMTRPNETRETTF